MVAVFPTGVKAQGNIKVQFVPTLATPSAPTVAVVSGTGTLDLSCFFTSAGFAPSIDVTKGNPPRRLCSTKQFEQFGITTYSLADLQYIYGPQAASASNVQLAYEKLVPGTSGFFVTRFGLDAQNTDWAAGQFVGVWPVTVGDRLMSGDPDDEFAEFMVTQPVIITGEIVPRVALT